ncbi:MAG: DUF1836 domain-containing protein [Oscillospiraceae bacterium]|nr:DUF1836 domain-containing protein [Oscillospiraceae bacterium]
MAYDKKLVAGKLRRWEKYLEQYSLPKWDDLPDFGLYMEQALALLTGYLDYLPPELKEEQFITAAAINNYVRKGIMPKPVKKKYYRVHMAYLVMICSLKQSLGITTLKMLIPDGLCEAEFKEIYDKYAQRHNRSTHYFIGQVRSAAAGILGHEMTGELATCDTGELIMSSAVVSGFSRLLAEKLLLLDNREAGNE